MPLFPAYAGISKNDKKTGDDIWSVTKDKIKIDGENKVFQVDSSSDESFESKRTRYDDVIEEIDQKKVKEDEESSKKHAKKKKDKKHKDKKHKSDKEYKKKKDKSKKSDYKNTQPSSTQSKKETPLPYTINTKPDDDTLHFETFHHPPIYKCRFKDFDEQSCIRLPTRYFSKPISTVTIDCTISTNNSSNNTYNHLIDFIPINIDKDDVSSDYIPSNKDENETNVERKLFKEIKVYTVAPNNTNEDIINNNTTNTTTNITTSTTTTATASNNKTSTTTANEDIQERYKEYLNQLNKNNYNLQLWIEFVNFQEMKYEFDTKNIKKPLNRKELIADLKLSVINDAITKNKERFEVTEWREKNKKINYKKKPLFDELLMMKMKMMMEMGEDKEVVVEAWKDILSKWGGVTLWKSYLTYMRSHASTVTQVIEAYKECFMVFKKKKYNDDVMMDTLSSISDFLVNSGYTELCTSIYQLLVGLNVDPPLLLKPLPLDDQLEFLGAYWSSGVGGFGEDGWVSFREWVEKKGDMVGGKNNDEQDQEEEWSILATNQDNLPLLWSQLETFRSRRQFLSWRKNQTNKKDGKNNEEKSETDQANDNIEPKINESTCEDESRDVPFEDISPFMFILTTNPFHLIFSFVILLLTNTPTWCSTCYVCDVCGAVMFGQVCSRHVSLSLPFHTSSIIDHLPQLPPHPSIELFKTSHAHFDLTHTNTLLQNIFKFAINHFTHLQKQTFIHLFITYQTHFLSLTKSSRTERNKELKQTYKELLKDVSDDVTIWLRYACFEARAGNYKQATKVVINNLANNHNNSPNKFMLLRYYYDFIVGMESSLFKGLCSMGADDGDDDVRQEKEAEVLISEMNGVFSLVDGRHKGPIMVDQFLSHLSHHLHDSLQDPSSPLPLHLCHLLSRLTFRTTHNIHDVMKLYDDVIKKINEKEGWEGGLRECMVRGVVLDRWVLLMGLKKRDDYQSNMSINKDTKLLTSNIAYKFSHVTLKTLATVNQSDIQLFPQDPIIAYNFYHVTPSSNVIGLDSDLNNDVMNVAYIMHLLRRLMISQDSQAGIKNKLKNFLEKCLNKTTTVNKTTQTTLSTNTPTTNTPTTTPIPTTERTTLLYSMLYTLFHVIQDPSNVNNAFYRSVQLHPFNKSLYMVCQSVDPALLVTVATVMMRRRMRVRTYLEELVLLSHAYQLFSTNQKKLSLT